MHFNCSECKQKGSTVLVLLIGLLIVGLIGVIAFNQIKGSAKTSFPQTSQLLKIPTPAPKSLSYTSQKLGFQFQYPVKGFTAQEDSEEAYNTRGNGDYRKNFKGYVGYEPREVIGAMAVLDQSNDFDKSPLAVWVFNNDSNLTIEQWFKDYWYYPFVWGVFDYTSKGHIALDSEATVSGQPAKYKIVSYQPGKPKFIYVSNKGKMYLLRIIGESGDQILSTFKFIN